MLINTFDVAAASGGAAFLGVRSPWTSLLAVGATHARTADSVPVAGTPGARRVAFRPGPALLMQPADMATGLPIGTDIRKQYVHKTREGAGNGAMGPHPEREPA